MANDTNLTIVGYLTADPELKSTQSGLAVVNITIAATPSKFSKETNEWVNGETTFMRASAWRTFAEQISASLKKGDKVVAVGRLVTQKYTDKDGNERSTMQLELESLGLDLSRPPKTGYAEVPRTQSSEFQVPAGWAEIPTPTSVDESPF
jgi:single-strand DNA-binding protein